MDIESAYWELVIKDIKDACKLFEEMYDQTDAGDGYVSVEVSPKLANETEATVEAAKWLHKVVNCRNVYIKIPATAECIPSIRDVIANGISVNVTVSFIIIVPRQIINKSKRKCLLDCHYLSPKCLSFLNILCLCMFFVNKYEGLLYFYAPNDLIHLIMLIHLIFLMSIMLDQIHRFISFACIRCS